jgi:DNA (cytosine-5)-methyltransferase 1
VINAAEYGYQQRRRRTFIFAYKNDTKYAVKMNAVVNYVQDFGEEIHRHSAARIILEEGFFARTFFVDPVDPKRIKVEKLPKGLGELSAHFSFTFENSGVMKDGIIYTVRTTPQYDGIQITLGDIMDTGDVDEKYFIPEEKLYYTYPESDHSDETHGKLPTEQRQTWQYIKGAKKLPRKAANGHEYIFSEGAIPMIDAYDKPARTMLTSEGSFSRTTHIVKDRTTGKIRLLTAEETERLQGFPTYHTKYCIVNGETVEMPTNKRRFMMGNALVVDLIKDMERTLSEIIEKE